MAEETEAPGAETDVETEPIEENLASSPYQISTTIADAGQIKSTDWVKGNPEARVTIVEYGDFQ